jgi:hypothetical protein
MAIRQRFDTHAQEAKALIDRRNVRLTARQSIEAFGDQHIKLLASRVGQQSLQAWPVDDRGARDSGILMNGHDREATRFGMAPRQAHLICDPACILKLTGEAGVDGCAHQILSAKISQALTRVPWVSS